MDSKTIIAEAATAFAAGEYSRVTELLATVRREEPQNLLGKVYDITAAALAQPEVNRESLRGVWHEIHPYLWPDIGCAQMEEIRQVIATLATTVYRRGNDWQVAQFAALQKDVNFEKKEFVLREFQRILLAADREYLAVLEFLYGYATAAALLVARREVSPPFLLGLLDNIRQAVALQFEIGLQEYFNPLDLAALACKLPLDDLPQGVEIRREVLDLALIDPQALERWEEFAPFADPNRWKELEKEARRAKMADKLAFWRRIKARIRKGGTKGK